MTAIQVRASRRARAHVRNVNLKNKLARALTREVNRLIQTGGHLATPSKRKDSLKRRLAVVNTHVDAGHRKIQVAQWATMKPTNMTGRLPKRKKRRR